MAPDKKTFYRRVLPKVCIDFASERGKQLFKDALCTGFMNCYFPLASQFRTQEEPAYCGLSSLVMVLNALAVDPGVVWKGVFRWYHEDMLDCCTSLGDVKEKGVTMDNLLCLATCNQLNGEIFRVKETSCIVKFREQIKDVTSRSDIAMIISYGRNVLGQTGTGHFSPVGGYNDSEDMVLILDVARFKYPPYWLPLIELWRAMNSLDTETGLPRGYMTLWRSDEKGLLNQPPLLFRISKGINAFKPMLAEVGTFLNKAKSFLQEQIVEESPDDVFKTILITLLKYSFPESSGNQSPIASSLLSLRLPGGMVKDVIQEEEDAVQLITQAIEETRLYKMMIGVVPDEICCRQNLFDLNEERSKLKCSMDDSTRMSEQRATIRIPHFFTVFLLSFPLDNLVCAGKNDCKRRRLEKDALQKDIDDLDLNTYSKYLKDLVLKELEEDNCSCHSQHTAKDSYRRKLLLNEVTQLRLHFVTLMSVP